MRQLFLCLLCASVVGLHAETISHLTQPMTVMNSNAGHTTLDADLKLYGIATLSPVDTTYTINGIARHLVVPRITGRISYFYAPGTFGFSAPTIITVNGVPYPAMLKCDRFGMAVATIKWGTETIYISSNTYGVITTIQVSAG
jgi:hypothetical protein